MNVSMCTYLAPQWTLSRLFCLISLPLWPAATFMLFGSDVAHAMGEMPPGGGRAVRVPFEWTAEERAQVVEALDRYPKWEVPKLRPSRESKVFWLDDVRVLMSVRELPNGWKAAEDEKSKIVAVNTDTLQIEETPYRGDLVCYSPDRMVVFDYPRPYLNYRKPGDTEQDNRRHVAGKYGETLRSVEWPKKGHILTPTACQITQRDAGTGRSVTVFPLRTGDGSIYAYSYGEEAHKYFWVNEQGVRLLQLAVGGRIPSESNTWYLKWLDAYFIGDAIPNYQQMLYMSGRSELLPPPQLLAKWARAYVGGGSAFMMKHGLLWHFNPMTGYYRKQGLYLQKENQLIRVDDGELVVRWAPSPNGCRLFYGRVAGEYRKSSNKLSSIFQNYVIDLCKEGAK